MFSLPEWIWQGKGNQEGNQVGLLQAGYFSEKWIMAR